MLDKPLPRYRKEKAMRINAWLQGSTKLLLLLFYYYYFLAVDC